MNYLTSLLDNKWIKQIQTLNKNIGLISLFIPIIVVLTWLPLYYDYNTFETLTIPILTDCPKLPNQVSTNESGDKNFMVNVRDCTTIFDSSTSNHRDARLIEEFLPNDLLFQLSLIFAIISLSLLITVYFLKSKIKQFERIP